MGATIESGFAVRTPSWHREETLLTEYPGRERAMELAGHNWNVKELPIYIQGKAAQRPASLDIHGVAVKVGEPIARGYKALVHGTTGETLAIVKASYEVVQNYVLWDLVDALANQPEIQYDTAGVLAGGTTLWVSVRLNEPIVLPGDDSPTHPYINATTTHDGSGSLSAKSTLVREVCVNTHVLAEQQAKAAGTYVSFKHTKNVHDRIAEARDIIRGARRHVDIYVELANELASLPISPAQHGLFLERFIPMPIVAAGTLVSERVVSNIEAARLAVEKLFDGPTIPEAHRATGYGLFLAATEYLDHLRPHKNADTYLGRTLLRSEPAKDNLVRLVRTVAAN